MKFLLIIPASAETTTGWERSSIQWELYKTILEFSHP